MFPPPNKWTDHPNNSKVDVHNQINWFLAQDMMLFVIYMLTARKPAPRFLRFFLLLDYFRVGGGGVGGLLTSLVFVLHDLHSDRLFYSVAHTSSYVGYVFSASLHTLRVTLDTCYLLCCTHTSCCVGYVLSASLHTLHVTLDMSSLLRCKYFMFCWICLLCFVAHTSCYVQKRWKATAGKQAQDWQLSPCPIRSAQSSQPLSLKQRPIPYLNNSW